MKYLVILVVHDIEKLEDVVAGWRSAGVGGATILPSLGLASLDKKRALREDMPLMPLMDAIFEDDEELNRTLFTIIDGKETLDKVVEVTQNILGDLDSPNNGVMAILPVEAAYGVRKRTDME
jgi:hypothetical protein